MSTTTSTSSSAPAQPAKTVRIVGWLCKKPGMSMEDFFAYWRDVHGPMFSNLEIVKKNITKYEQHHYTNAFDAGLSVHGYCPPGDRIGIAVFEARCYEDIFEVFASEEYKSTVYLDELNLFDRKNCVFFPGETVTFIDRA
ncbi:hypothetical protein C2E23DRAFT_866797 [Lenzites betulinus]|nr:hypothetical protein C2E23DRAFT_866797 [Lenzites betulinus]